MIDAINAKLLAIYVTIQTWFYSFTKEERGDTNFISILIILAIVIILLGVFIGFKDTIISKVTEIVNNFDIH